MSHAAGEQTSVAGWLAAAVLVAAGAWIRARGWSTGFAPDEFANVHPGTVWEVVFDLESAVNPPLLRVLMNGGWPDTLAIPVGRAVSLVSSVVFLPLLFLLALRATRSEAAALGALALAVVAPPSVLMSTRARAYGLWTLLAVVHLLALSRGAEGQATRRHELVAAVSAVALVYTHYITVALAPVWCGLMWLTGVHTRAWRLWVPAALSLAPMAPLVLLEDSTRVATQGSPIDSLAPILALQLSGPATLGVQLARTAERHGIAEWWPMAAVITGLVVLSTLGWRRHTPTMRLLALGAAALVPTLLVLGTVQFVRAPVATMWLVFAAPLIAGLVVLPRRPSVQAALAGVLMAAALAPPQSTALLSLHETLPENGFKALARSWSARVTDRGVRRVYISPGFAYTGAHLYLTGTHVRDAPEPPGGCGVARACFVHEGVVIGTMPAEPIVDGLIIAVEDPASERLVDGCTQLDSPPKVWIWACGDAVPP